VEPPENHLDQGEHLCHHCGHSVPPLRYCVRCGWLQDHAGRRHEFAAHPGEPARALRLFSTLFPHLPQAGYDSFRHAFALGIAVVAVLVIAGLFPLALVAAAILVPVLFVLYFIEADLYERAPLTIIAATLVWGALIGLFLGSAARLASGSAAADSTSNLAAAVPGAVVLALLGAALATIAPLALIRHRAFNDVLDGATFGAISGAVYASTAAVVRAADLLRAGLHPGGDPLPWLVRLATLGIAEPILVAATVGSVCAAFWLRFRAPVRDRNALGWLGVPAIALLAGVALLAGAAAARVVLDLTGGLLTTTVAAGGGLIWLRATIHVGLLEEANEAEIGPPVRCANCGHLTPGHTFCGWCGVSLQAQPKSPAPSSVAPDPTNSTP
jgi:hypothetical protein